MKTHVGRNGCSPCQFAPRRAHRPREQPRSGDLWWRGGVSECDKGTAVVANCSPDAIILPVGHNGVTSGALGLDWS
eukprot:1434966-Prymnesium_polylepis.1